MRYWKVRMANTQTGEVVETTVLAKTRVKAIKKVWKLMGKWANEYDRIEVKENDE